jgi:hypothetical protein
LSRNLSLFTPRYARDDERCLDQARHDKELGAPVKRLRHALTFVIPTGVEGSLTFFQGLATLATVRDVSTGLDMTRLYAAASTLLL